jgi:hypothetical protein
MRRRFRTLHDLPVMLLAAARCAARGPRSARGLIREQARDALLPLAQIDIERRPAPRRLAPSKSILRFRGESDCASRTATVTPIYVDGLLYANGFDREAIDPKTGRTAGRRSR